MAKVKAMDGQTDKYFKQFFISGASSFTSFSAKKKKKNKPSIHKIEGPE